MKIIEPSFEIITPKDTVEGIEKLRLIERTARISHRSEDKQTFDSYERFIKAVVLQHGDWSVAEHASATVIFHTNRGITHEIVRHRLFSFTQESTRFVNYSKEGFEAVFIPSVGIRSEDFGEWIEDFYNAERVYRKWLSRGYSPQIARDHLPQALGAQIAVTGNLRNWRWLFLARSTKEAHPDARQLVLPLLDEFKQRIPLLYDDIEPLQKQSISMAKIH